MVQRSSGQFYKELRGKVCEKTPEKHYVSNRSPAGEADNWNKNVNDFRHTVLDIVYI